jgi:hypothetical protein
MVFDHIDISTEENGTRSEVPNFDNVMAMVVLLCFSTILCTKNHVLDWHTQDGYIVEFLF